MNDRPPEDDPTVALFLREQGYSDEDVGRLGFGKVPRREIKHLNAVVHHVCCEGRRYTLAEAIEGFGLDEVRAALRNDWVHVGPDDFLHEVESLDEFDEEDD